MWEPRELTDLAERRSAAGEFHATLRARSAYKDLRGHRLHVRTHAGKVPGPTLRARPGDVLRPRLLNDRPPNRDPMPREIDLPHHFTTTNLYARGLHVDPGGIAYSVFRAMEPGHACDVEIAIPPDHPAGTFRRHPHNHGSADVQIPSGTAGALIIEGDVADVPEIAVAKECVLILSEVLCDRPGTIETCDPVWPEARRASSRSTGSGSRSCGCSRARCNAGASFEPRTRTTIASVSVVTTCTSSPATASRCRAPKGDTAAAGGGRRRRRPRADPPTAHGRSLQGRGRHHPHWLHMNFDSEASHDQAIQGIRFGKHSRIGSLPPIVIDSRS